MDGYPLGLGLVAEDKPFEFSCTCMYAWSLQNFPLYIRTVNPQNETDLQFQYLVHISIDVIEEKSTCVCIYNVWVCSMVKFVSLYFGELNLHRLIRNHGNSLTFNFCICVTAVSTLSSPKGPSDPREHYLGLLYPSEQYKVYPTSLSLSLSLKNLTSVVHTFTSRTCTCSSQS